MGTESFSSTPKQTRARQIDFCLYFEPSTAEFCTGGAKECAALKQEEACLVFEPSTAEFCTGGAKECAPLKQEKPCLVFEPSTAVFCAGGAKECAALKQEEALFGLRAQYCRVLCWRCKRVRSPQKRSPVWSSSSVLQSSVLAVQKSALPSNKRSPVWSSSPVLQSSVLAVQKSALPSNKRKPCLVFEPSTAEFCTGDAKECAALKQEEALFGLCAQCCRIMHRQYRSAPPPETRESGGILSVFLTALQTRSALWQGSPPLYY